MSKIFNVMAAVACMAAMVSSCDDAAKLARQVEGTWQGNPQAVPGTAPMITTMTDTWTFVADDAKARGGSLIITSMASVECPLTMEGYDTIAPASAAYAVTVAGTVSLNATWDLDAHDPKDDILVSVDPKSLNVKIDPTAVTVSSDGNPATLDSIPPMVYANARNALVEAAQKRFFPINRLDDVEVIKDESVQFEIPAMTEDGHDTKVTLRRQGAVTK